MPDWVTVIQEAQYWQTTPMEIEAWPLHRILEGQTYREATQEAQEILQKRNR